MFSYGWPAPHRVLQSCVEAVQACTDEILGEQTNVVTGIRSRIHRFQPLVVDQGVTGAVEAMSLWAGESVTGVKQVRPAAEIVRELADEAEQLLRRWTARE